MKIKSFMMLALTGLTLLFTGCGSETLEEPTAREYETHVGEFLSLGGTKVNSMITHLFENEDGDIYYAYSDRYDLDDEEYSNLDLEVYGVVMSYDSLDKDVFEVRRITDAPEVDEEEVNLEDIDYKDTDLGVSFTYPNNWTITALRDSVQLKAPMPELEADEDGVIPELELGVDYMIVAKMDITLNTTSEDTQDLRAEEIRAYAVSNYEGLSEQTDSLTYIGQDRQFSVRYKSDTGDIVYFVPRGTDLYEISFYHPEQADYDLLTNSNTFSEIVATFRFIPNDGEEVVEEEEVVEVVEVVEEDTTPVVVTGYREFESNPYNFKISYPSSWYYSGGNGGYDFSSEPLEDETDPDIDIRLDLNIKSNEGISYSGTDVQVTVEVDSTYYTLTGTPDYQDVIQIMADSISATTEGEE